MATSLVHSLKAATGAVSAPVFQTTAEGITSQTTSDYTVADAVSVVLCNNYSPITVTLPAASTNLGRYLTITHLGTGGVVVDAAGSDKVCGLDQAVLLQKGESLKLVAADTANWAGIGHSQDSLERWTNFCSLFAFSNSLATQQQSPSVPTVFYNRMKLPDQWPSYKYTCETLATNFGNENKIGNMTLMPNGKVLALGVNTVNRLFVFDPATYTSSTVLTGYTTVGFTNPFCAAVVCFNGYVSLIPQKCAHVGLFKPPYAATGDYQQGPNHGHTVVSTYVPFAGGVQTKNGSGNWVVVMTPYGSSNVGLYYPEVDGAGTYADGPSVGTEQSGNGRYRNAVLAQNGKVVFGGYSSVVVGVYDPVANTLATVSVSGGQFLYALKPTLNGWIMCHFNGNTYLYKYDPVSGTTSNSAALVPAVQSNIAALPNGHLIVSQPSSDELYIVDPVTETVAARFTGAHVGEVGCLLPDGRYLWYYSTGEVRCLYTGLDMPMALCTHSLFNAY